MISVQAEREEEEVERAKEEEKRAKEEKKRAEEGKEDEKGAERRASLLETLSFPGPEESPIVSHRTRLQHSCYNYTPAWLIQEEDAVISSPRSSMVYQRQATAETSEEGDASGEIEGDILLPPSPPHCQVMVDGWPSYHKEPQTQLDASQRHLAKKIRRLKRHLNEEEEAFKAARGYRPSKADMMSHETMSPLLHQIKEAKMEMKRMKEERDNGRSTSRRPHILQTIINIEKRLEELRGEAGRPESLTAMTPDEVSGEKLDVQRALVYLESLHGKPNTREDKAMVQHIYQRYRLLKRLVARSVTTMGMSNSLSTSARSGGSSTLCEIPEHRVLELPEFSPSPSGRGEDSSPSPPQQDPDGDPGLEVEQLQEKYTVSTLKELVQKQRLLLEHRKELKREIRLFEEQFEVEYGRMPRTDEDRAPLAQTYRLYKSIKAKLRLVDALRHKAASCE
ncbi:unnamed protein product [Darwinula stevensoni]|uniref:FAM13A-like domain-containing protein n=1 Tax=Darwinula stevensoni TaxID=69355 RepID=A0A7R9AHG1_9CRUS|nr:unnamed protein product [Darwinula stevensoni]CAG0904345.1 unnamed protein product [Darwinula stevensoni]